MKPLKQGGEWSQARVQTLLQQGLVPRCRGGRLREGGQSGRTQVPGAWGSVRAGGAAELCTPCRIQRNASADELVCRAVDAATAYENILNAIKAAEDAADKAASASESALQVGTCLHGHLL